MKLSKIYRQAVESLESEARQGVRAALEAGHYSDDALAIESHVANSAKNAAAVVTLVHEAMEAQCDVEELREMSVEAAELHDRLTTVNEHGGFTAESLYWANEACAATFDRVGGIRPLKAASVESDTPAERFAISLEDFQTIEEAIEAARGDVSAKSLDAIERVFCALEKALPEIRDRMQALKDTMGSIQYDEEKQICLDDYITKQLSVNGQVPPSLKDYLMGYCRFADALMGAYSENALEAASKSPMLGDCLTGLKDDQDPVDALCTVFKAIGDPRCAIAPDQLGFVLPGSGPLFGVAIDADAEADTPDGPQGDLLVRLKRFSEDHAPLDPLSYDDRPDAERDADGKAPTVRVLSKDTICRGLDLLIRQIDGVNIKSYADARRDAWVKARSAFQRYRQALQSVSPTQAAQLRPLLAAIGEYCDTLFTLSSWPALHFLANLVFTSNAFILFAECSISGRSAEEPEAAPADTAEGEAETAAVVATIDADADAAAPAGGELADQGGAAPDAKPMGEVGAVAVEPATTDAATEPAAEPAEEPASTDTAGEAPIPAAPEEEEAPAGGEVIPPAGETAPTGDANAAEVIPPASDEEEEEGEEDPIPNAKEEEEENAAG